MTRAEALQAFRNREVTLSEQLLIRTILSDAIATAVLAVWPLDGIRDGWEQNAGAGVSDNAPQEAVWVSIWDGISIDAEWLATLANFPSFALEPRVDRLIAAKLVFPDGSVSQTAVEIALQAAQPARRAPTRRKATQVVPPPPAAAGDDKLKS